MVWDRYVRIVLILGMVSCICSIAGAGAVGIIAETRITSGSALPVCTAPCDCISESYAAMTWGAEGYEKCSKTICGQTADGNVQFYCIHPVATSAAPTATATTTPTAVPQETVPTVSVTPAASPAAAATTQKAPAGIATVVAAIGTAALAAAGMRRR
jgi:hypothetical protein